MARILLAYKDPVAAAAVRDLLEAADHRTSSASDGAELIATAGRQQPDLVLLALPLPGASPDELITAVRDRATRGCPLLVLAESPSSAERLRLLRAGATDVIPLPCELAEIGLRVERFLAWGGSQPATLQGRLEGQPLWAVLQFVESAGTSGELVLRGGGAGGRLVLEGGQVVHARFGELSGTEAFLALASLEQGSFSLLPGSGPSPTSPDEALKARYLLMQAAWIHDELSRRRDQIPATGTPLEAVGTVTIEPDPEGPPLPIDELYAEIAANPGLRLFELLGGGRWAPQKIRLGVARLIEIGAVAAQAEGRERLPTTRQIESSFLLEATIEEVIAGAGELDSNTLLAVIVVADPGPVSELARILGKLPGGGAPESVSALQKALAAGQDGSARLGGNGGWLYVRAVPLRDDTVEQADGVLAAADRALVWLADGEPSAAADKILDRLARSRPEGRAVVVAADEASQAAVRRRLEPGPSWRISETPPSSLLGLLRLLA